MSQLFTRLLQVGLLLLAFSSATRAQKLPKLTPLPTTKGTPYDSWPTTLPTNDRRQLAVLNKGGQANFVAQGSTWGHPFITYAFANGTPDIANDGGRQAVRDAFALWAAQTPLTFVEVSAGSSCDITVFWAAGSHGDNNAFDGPFGVLAHAFFPNAGLSGDIHFDEDETWTDAVRFGGGQPIDLVTVAAHEIGHSLGLDHSTAPDALMQANYFTSHRCLGADDIAGIQSLYGARSYIVNGPYTFCSGSATYSVPGVPANVPVNWTSSNPSIASIDATTGVATVVGSGNVFFTATFLLSSCTSASQATTIYKDVAINTVPLGPQVNTPYWDCVDGPGPVAAYIDNYDPTATYNITTTNNIRNSPPGIIQETINGKVVGVFRLRSTRAGSTGNVQVRVTACGGSSTTGFNVTAPDCSSGGFALNPTAQDLYTLYPNPATSEVTVQPVAVDRQDAASIKQTPFSVRVYDSQGYLRLEQSGQQKLGVGALPSGLYLVHILREGELIERQQLQIER